MSQASPRKKRKIGTKHVKVGKSQMVSVVRETAGVSKADALLIVNALLGEIRMALLKGSSVGLADIGTLTVRPTQARRGNLPKSGEAFETPAGRKVAFKISDKLRNEL